MMAWRKIAVEGQSAALEPLSQTVFRFSYCLLFPIQSVHSSLARRNDRNTTNRAKVIGVMDLPAMAVAAAATTV
jgi:hypothetical protein